MFDRVAWMKALEESGGVSDEALDMAFVLALTANDDGEVIFEGELIRLSYPPGWDDERSN